MAIDHKQDFTTKYRRQIIVIALVVLAVVCLVGFVQSRNAAMERDRVEEIARSLTTESPTP